MKPLMIEVGAFDGKDSLEMHSKGYEVVTFEPKHSLAQSLKEKTSDLPLYKVIEKAVSNFNGKTMFYECVHGGASSILKFRSDEELNKHWTPQRSDIHYSGISYEVDVTRLDTFLINENMKDRTIDFLHIDAQGVDLEVLQGLGSLIKNVKKGVLETVKNVEKSIYIEQHNTLKNVENFLSASGFKIDRVEGNDWTACEFNVFFAKI
jgi:FkbM family methyltransferase